MSIYKQAVKLSKALIADGVSPSTKRRGKNCKFTYYLNQLDNTYRPHYAVISKVHDIECLWELRNFYIVANIEIDGESREYLIRNVKQVPVKNLVYTFDAFEMHKGYDTMIKKPKLKFDFVQKGAKITVKVNSIRLKQATVKDLSKVDKIMYVTEAKKCLVSDLIKGIEDNRTVYESVITSTS